jgi:hypothetical protein
LILHSQSLALLASVSVERGDLAVARDFAHRATQTARQDYAVHPKNMKKQLVFCLQTEADILDSSGRLDEARGLDLERMHLDPGMVPQGVLVRAAVDHMAHGEDVQAELLLRRCLFMPEEWQKSESSKTIEDAVKSHTVLADLLERRGTEEALAEARTLRDKVAQHLARHEARRSAALQETRAAAAEAVRQWREERIKVTDEKKGGKKKGKKKGRKGKAKGKGKGASSAAAAIEGEQPHEPAGGGMEGAAAVEGAAATEAEQQALSGEAHPPGEEEEVEKEECAICLQDLELEDDEGEGVGFVVLTCGHRFHEICGDMWCAKCADKRWGVTCPGCRAPYVQVRR